MNSKLIPILIIIWMCSCKTEQSYDIESEIIGLKTKSSRERFLEEIHKDDQLIRKKSQKVTEKYGFNSEKELEITKELQRIDSLNLVKIEYFLKHHKHPTDEFSEEARLAPWVVIHHASDIESRYKYYPYLRGAYEKGYLDEGHFSLYLDRFYIRKFGQRFSMPNPYKEKERIDSLVKKLSLDILYDSLDQSGK